MYAYDSPYVYLLQPIFPPQPPLSPSPISPTTSSGTPRKKQIPSSMTTKTIAVTILSLSLIAGSVNAALITGTTIQSADIGGNLSMTPSDAIDGSGLTSGLALTGVHSTTWSDHWWSNSSTPQITLDMEGNYSLNTIHIWNYNETVALNRGLQNVAIYVSPDENEANLVKLITSGVGVNNNGSGDFMFMQATGLSTYSGFDLDISGITNASLLNNARLVRIQTLDTHGSTTGGLAEVQFGGTAVPEPSSVALLSLGSLALLRRRRS
jgi:hypothetical protein